MKRANILWALAALALVVCAAGCFNPFRPLVGSGAAAVLQAPAATSAQGALRRLRWCWVNQRIAEYEELFTEDFEFVFSDVEAIDNPPLLRDDEIERARHIFVDGSASQPRAKRISLDFSNSLLPIPDQRRGKMSPWHVQVNTGVTLTAELQDQIWDVQGNVVFYLVRGDSAHLPAVLQSRGPNPAYWYIEQWEDKTASGQGGSSLIRHLLDLARAGEPGASPSRVAAAAVATRGSGAALASRGANATLTSRGAAAPLDFLPEFHGSWGGLKQLYR